MTNDNYFSVNYNDPYCKYEEDMDELKFGFECKTETKAGLYKGSVGMNYCNYIIGESSYNSSNSKKIEIPTKFEKLVESSVLNNDKRDLILTKHGIILKSRRNGGFYDLLKEFKRGAKLTKEEFHFIETVINRYKRVDSDTARYTISNIINYMSCNNEIFIHGSSGLINTCIELEPKFINRVYEYYREVLSSENGNLPIRNDIQKITTYNFIKYSLLPVDKKINIRVLVSIALSARELFKYEEDIPLYIAVNYYKLDKGEIDKLGDDALNILVASKHLAPYVFLNLSSTKRMKALLSLGISKQFDPELLYANEYLHPNGKSRMIRRVLDIDNTGKIYQYIQWL